MPDITSGTPHANAQTAVIGGLSLLVAEDSRSGARSWFEERVADQDAGAEQGEEFEIDISDLSNGYGYTYEGDVPKVFESADGWDASSPGKLTTWPRRATGATFTSADYRGQQFFIGNYLYVCRGRFVCKYAPNDTANSTWAIIERHDLGDGMVVAGRVGQFAGNAYVPRRQGAGGALQRFHELTTVVSTAVEVQTIVISGTPTGGDFIVHFDGKDSTAIAVSASANTVRTALRTIAGLEAVTVVRTGSDPNYTYTVTMTGVAGALGASSAPQMTSTDSLTGGAHAIAHATTVAGTTDTWTLGPSGIEARCFKLWKETLVRAEGNIVSRVADDPMTAGDWGPEYAIGDAGHEITDLAVWDKLLIAGKTDGPWSFDESNNTTNELPDLQAIVDDANCLGMEEVGGWLVIPHKTGLIHMRPGEQYGHVGPAQEGRLEGALTTGWGRVQSIAPFGRYAFYAVQDFTEELGAVGSLQPGNDVRFPLVPQMHQLEAGFLEHALIISQATEPALPHAPGTLADDNAVGTITWGSTANAAASDDARATAAIGTSHYLKATNFGFNIPAAATVIGVLVEIERRAVGV